RGEVVERGGSDQRDEHCIAESCNPQGTQKLAEDPRKRGGVEGITTPDLIEALAESMSPVRRLRPPLVLASCWLLLAAGIFGLVGVSQGVRPDILQRLQQSGFVIGMTASVLTGIGAGFAAFMVSLPDRSRLWLILPIPAVFVWL